MRYLSLLVLSQFLLGCMSMANIDYDRNVDFYTFTTYQVQKEPIKTGEDTRITTPFMQERIVNAINTELAKKGLIKKDKPASLTIKYHISVATDIETEGSSVSFGFGTGTHHSAIGMGFVFPVGETYSVDKMVLTIDMYSTSNKLVWRGSLAYRMDAGATPDVYTRIVNNLVEDILKEFPPK